MEVFIYEYLHSSINYSHVSISPFTSSNILNDSHPFSFKSWGVKHPLSNVISGIMEEND